MMAMYNGHFEVLLEDSAPSRFSKCLAQRHSVGAHDGDESYSHHTTGVVELMSAKLLHEKREVCTI